jgi:hypothetical protein
VRLIESRTAAISDVDMRMLGGPRRWRFGAPSACRPSPGDTALAVFLDALFFEEDGAARAGDPALSRGSDDPDAAKTAVPAPAELRDGAGNSMASLKLFDAGSSNSRSCSGTSTETTVTRRKLRPQASVQAAVSSPATARR